jgi:(p)ppGpp synthase/HD superfamily hydrolase
LTNKGLFYIIKSVKPDEFKLKKELAVALATNAHAYKTKDGKPQTYDGKPYTVHLMAVEINLKRFGIDSLNGERDQNLLIGAWLHDTLEDTTVSYDEILNEFGKDIADLVYSVTNESGANRKERSLKTYPKISAHPYDASFKITA